MLVISPSKSLQKLELINTIQLLGYEEWIGECSNLHAVALSFQLLRQQGFYVSSDVFRKFTDDQGNYNRALVNDMQGLLSLYEAAQFRGANEWEEKEHKDLKEEVRKMLVISPSKSLQKLGLINTIQLLGVAYHFEHEIEESLSEIYNGYEEWIGEFGESHDLHVVALSFRLLRQQGYYVSSDVFRKFIDDQENYNKALFNDMQGLLSLYEAAQFRVYDEEILDEAINFTTTHLKLLLPKLSNSLSTQVSYALKYPTNKTIARVATRKYISFYQEDKSCDQVILTFAKLDFNTLQKMHKRELCDITRWWKELDLANELPFARDRVIELYFWSLGVYFEPQYNVARKILTKMLCFVSITADIYDTYGTLHELTLLTNAIERS
ncbi:hypothetical protein KY284_031800 [Solanum tuberosum]|nr:hypothetical protein KY284_031800 [Solanum tuberosum]